MKKNFEIFFISILFILDRLASDLRWTSIKISLKPISQGFSTGNVHVLILTARNVLLWSTVTLFFLLYGAKITCVSVYVNMVYIDLHICSYNIFFNSRHMKSKWCTYVAIQSAIKTVLKTRTLAHVNILTYSYIYTFMYTVVDIYINTLSHLI